MKHKSLHIMLTISLAGSMHTASAMLKAYNINHHCTTDQIEQILAKKRANFTPTTSKIACDQIEKMHTNLKEQSTPEKSASPVRPNNASISNTQEHNAHAANRSEEISKQVSTICTESIAQTERGRHFFHIPHYEYYLDNTPNISLEALLNTPESIISRLTTAAKKEPTPSQEISRFIARQKAIIYCETTRELLKRNLEKPGSVSPAEIAKFKKLSLESYASSYGERTAAYYSAAHIARHRWNECFCANPEFHTMPLVRNKHKAKFEK